MQNKILFIFEGTKLEQIITDSLSKFFIHKNTIITCAYCTTIYKIYSEISKDNDLDTFNLVKEINHNQEKLKNFKRSDFAEIYLFFDYDGHASNASDDKLIDLLNFFNEETDNGKLYLSYPMVEALKHIENKDNFETLIVNCKENIDYKKVVSKKGLDKYKNIFHFDEIIWYELIDFHLKKMNKIVNNSYTFPNEIIDQLTIFKNQLEKYINIDAKVSVLSAFPVFIHDYFGNNLILNHIKDLNEPSQNH